MARPRTTAKPAKQQPEPKAKPAAKAKLATEKKRSAASPAEGAVPRAEFAAPDTLGGGALESAANVADRRVVGFGHTAMDDDLFALGYPHLALLFDDRRDPVVEATWMLLEGYPHRQVSFARQAATLFVRAQAGGGAVDLPGGEPVLTTHAKRALASKGPLRVDELPELIGRMLGFVDPSTDVILYLFEALLGTVPTLEALVASLLGADRAFFFRRAPVSARWLDPIAMLLSRAPARAGDALRRRLISWADGAAIAADQRARFGMATLEGASLVAPPRTVVHATAADVVAARRAGAANPWYTLPDPRLVYLGGDEVYRVELGLWRRYTDVYAASRAHALIVERFGRIRSACTVELMTDMAARSKAPDAARAWLAAHR
ncbi:MAG: hypothetical protein IT374_17330 [Polyangiaceae bacterium]|nr:hypothetical protein [Polyangiaceae bacterium]